MSTSDEVAAEVLRELASAMLSNPPQHSLHEGYAVILEEMDELWEEVKTNPRKNPVRLANARKEAIQIAAMAIRLVVDVCDK